MLASLPAHPSSFRRLSSSTSNLGKASLEQSLHTDQDGTLSEQVIEELTQSTDHASVSAVPQKVVDVLATTNQAASAAACVVSVLCR